MSIQTARTQASLLVDSLGIRKPPVDVKEVAKRLGLQVHLMDLHEEVSGMLISKPDMSCIVVRKQDGESRQRFSIAHEIAHYYLRHQFEPGEHVHVDRGHLISHRNKRSATGTDLKEIEANQFAACLLMPSKLVRERVAKFKTGHIYDVHISALAREFGVSEQAMAIRLNILGLL